MSALSPEAIQKLENAQNIWFCSVRPDGRPHMTPVWFVYIMDRIYIGIDPKSVKRRNIARNPNVVLALEEGNHPVICEGSAHPLSQPYPEDMLQRFQQKYEWDIRGEAQYNEVIEIIPSKWIVW